MYRIITVEREYGCGAAQIARQLSSKLGWKLWDQDLTAEIARAANVDSSAVSMCEERVDSAFQRLVKVFWRGSYERSMHLEHQPFGPDRMVEVGEQVMREIAEQGNCVIVGRGAPYFLRERSDVFHVFLYAPRGEKLRRIQEQGRGLHDAEDSPINGDDRAVAAQMLAAARGFRVTGAHRAAGHHELRVGGKWRKSGAVRRQTATDRSPAP